MIKKYFITYLNINLTNNIKYNWSNKQKLINITKTTLVYVFLFFTKASFDMIWRK